MARKPLLRFELVSAAGGDGDADHTKALSAAARFLAASLAVIEKAEKEQSVALLGVEAVVTQARESFEDSLLEVSALESDWESSETDLGKFYTLSQKLTDKAKTLAESFAGAMDGDMNKEADRKERFRGMLQESVVEYAQILLALNELTDKIKTDWKVRVDTKRKVEPLQVVWEVQASGDDSPPEAGVAKSSGNKPPRPARKVPATPRKPTTFAFRSEQDIEKYGSFRNENWRIENGGVRFTEFHSNSETLVSRQAYVGDFAVQVSWVDGDLIRLHACGTEFEAKGKGGYARLERRGNVLNFQAANGSTQSITLKQGQRDLPTNISIGQVGKILLTGVTIIGTPAETE